MEFSNSYIIRFAVGLCLVCALVVSALAVGLKERQDANAKLFKAMNVLSAAGVLAEGETATKEEVDKYFESINYVVIDRESGQILEGEDAASLDLKKMAKDPENSHPTPKEFKNTLVRRVPNKLVAYEVNVEGHEGLVLPISGYGLWSNLYGYIALSPDGLTVKGITYYEHGETAGLGGEVENPSWKGMFPGKSAMTPDGDVQITVVKAGTVKNPDYEVDGISGATITSVGVGAMLQLWLGEHAYGPYLKNKREGGN